MSPFSFPVDIRSSGSQPSNFAIGKVQSKSAVFAGKRNVFILLLLHYSIFMPTTVCSITLPYKQEKAYSVVLMLIYKTNGSPYRHHLLWLNHLVRFTVMTHVSFA